jgi:glutamine cyclotransferase
MNRAIAAILITVLIISGIAVVSFLHNTLVSSKNPSSQPSATPTATPSDSNLPSPSDSTLPSPSELPTESPSEIPTDSPSPVPTPSDTPTPTPTLYTYQVINAFLHDQNAFTEGLVYDNGTLYEGTGLYGNSTLRRVNLDDGTVLQLRSLPKAYFGEGITVFNNKIIQLTWQEHIGFVYDENTFALQRNFTYTTQGWGLTNNGTQLIMSDGTANLYFLNPQTYQKTGQIQVHDGANPILNLNELEYINGSVYANVWQTNKIAIINPQTGQVQGWIDLTGIGNIVNTDPNAVLNGIAYDAKNDRLFVTGKMWPNLFEIKIIPLD